MKLPRRQFLYLAAGAAAQPAVARIARAQSYPARPVRVIVTYAPGGPTDVFGRLITQKLSEQLGRQFFVENIGGAGGNIVLGHRSELVPIALPIAARSASLASLRCLTALRCLSISAWSRPSMPPLQVFTCLSTSEK